MAFCSLTDIDLKFLTNFIALLKKDAGTFQLSLPNDVPYVNLTIDQFLAKYRNPIKFLDYFKTYSTFAIMQKLEIIALFDFNIYLINIEIEQTKSDHY